MPIIRISFSSFGCLFTVVIDDDLKPQLEDIVREVAGAGFVFVPVEELGGPYTGKHERLRGFEGMTWFTRFFHYL